MIGTTKSMQFEYPMPRRLEGDASWYGTVWMVAACLVVLATLYCSG